MIAELSVQVVDDRCIGPLLQEILAHTSFLELIEHLHIKVNIVKPGMCEDFLCSETLLRIPLQQTP